MCMPHHSLMVRLLVVVTCPRWSRIHGGYLGSDQGEVSPRPNEVHQGNGSWMVVNAGWWWLWKMFNFKGWLVKGWSMIPGHDEGWSKYEILNTDESNWQHNVSWKWMMDTHTRNENGQDSNTNDEKHHDDMKLMGLRFSCEGKLRCPEYWWQISLQHGVTALVTTV